MYLLCKSMRWDKVFVLHEINISPGLRDMHVCAKLCQLPTLAPGTLFSSTAAHFQPMFVWVGFLVRVKVQHACFHPTPPRLSPTMLNQNLARI